MGKVTYITLLLISLTSGCGTLAIVSSPPGAEIGIVMPGKEIPEPLGKTPFERDLTDLSTIVNKGTVILIVRKQGYEPQRFVIPNIPNGNLRIESYLLPNLPSNYKEVNKIISKVLLAERHILESRFDEALKLAEAILSANSNIASAYEIKGAVYFLQRKFKKSRHSWIRALELDPNNPEAESMLKKVEALASQKAQSSKTIKQ